MELKYDKAADAIYIKLSDMPYSYGKDLDDLRRIDYDADGNPMGIELLCVSEGVIPNDLPQRGEVERLLEKYHIKLPA
jgi:uncharacterized protein YuzE